MLKERDWRRRNRDRDEEKKKKKDFGGKTGTILGRKKKVRSIQSPQKMV